MKTFPFVVALVALTAVASCRKSRTPDKFVFAQDFKGGAAVVYGVTGAPPLPVVDGVRVIEVPGDGVLQTSSEQEDGSATDQYLQHQGSALRPLSVSSGAEEVYGGTTGSIGSCASVRSEYVGEGVRTKVGEMQSKLSAKLLGSVCKPK
jgi:hypothetical protein